jgi:hypothetical protein
MKRRMIGSMTVVLFASLAACRPPPDELVTQSRFDEKEVAWAAEKGRNTITGRVVLRTDAGKTYTCFAAWLAPDSTFQREIVNIVFGSTENAVFSYKDRPLKMRYMSAMERWREGKTKHESSCDREGRFTFRYIPDGPWFLTAMAGPVSDSWGLMRRIEVRGNSTMEVNLP